MSTELINPPELAPPIGFAHAVIGKGRAVPLAGQVGCDGDGRIVSPGDLVEQFGLAVKNLRIALEAAGGKPTDLAFLRIYTTEVATYRARAKELGVAYREHFGKHFPAMALLGVHELFDPEALVEIEGLAYVD
ncbi:MAG: RidA family protein [Planctomycetota bacterium]